MNVLVSVNDTYVMPLVVMLTSLFVHNNPAEITVWLMHMGLGEAHVTAIRQVVEGRGAMLEVVEMDPSLFEGYPTASYISRETYLRLLSGEVLPQCLHRVLWLDADLVVVGDIREFYASDFGGCGLVACGHGDDVPQSMREHCARIGVRVEEYVNAGVLLINLDVWRRRDMRAEARAIVDTYEELRYADQDMVNIIFEGAIALADHSVYNMRTNQRILPAEEPEVRERARIVHYCGKLKPWMFTDVPLADLWRDAYAQSPYAGRKLRLISSVGLSRLVGKWKERAGT